MKTWQSKKRLPPLLISQVNQYDFINYQKKFDTFLKSINKINSIFDLTELASEVLIISAVTIWLKKKKHINRKRM